MRNGWSDQRQLDAKAEVKKIQNLGQNRRNPKSRADLYSNFTEKTALDKFTKLVKKSTAYSASRRYWICQ